MCVCVDWSEAGRWEVFGVFVTWCFFLFFGIRGKFLFEISITSFLSFFNAFLIIIIIIDVVLPLVADSSLETNRSLMELNHKSKERDDIN